MNDFVNQFWNWYVILLVLLSIIACGVMLWSQSTPPPAKVDTTGHVWDETLEEYNNPLPKWWMWLFYLTVIFSLVYCALYPTLGWGLGLCIHAAVVLGALPGSRLYQRLLQQERDRLQLQSDPW